MLDYGLGLEFGTYKLINIFLQVYNNKNKSRMHFGQKF